MARDLNEFVVSARLRTDQIVEFVREVQIELARQRRALPVLVGGGAAARVSPGTSTRRCPLSIGARVCRDCAISSLAGGDADGVRTRQRTSR